MTGPDASPERPVATPSQTVGPFFHFALAADESVGTVAAAPPGGAAIRLRISVFDGDGSAVPDALIELYQADPDGHYGTSAFPGFGRLPTGADGTCVFETVRPGSPTGGTVVQAPHINLCVFARGLLRHLYTRVYFSGDPALDADPILSLAPPARRATLLATPAAADGTWDFAVRLQGEAETVFFDF